MCTANEYSFVYPDGHKAKPRRDYTLCSASRHGVPCPATTSFKYPPQPIPFSTSAPTSSPYLSAQYPPTPSYTPRSGTPHRSPHRSGNESDHSGYRSSSSARSKNKHAPSVYINGQKIYSSAPGERVVLVNGPPTPRSPRRNFALPHTAPSSPQAPYIVDADPRSYSSSRHPVIVDDRPPHIEIDIVDSDSSRRHHRKEHRRHPSSGSYNSYDEDSYSRRHRKDAEKEARRAAERSRDLIAEHNAKINARAPVPVPQPPQPLRRSDTDFARREAELVEQVARLNLKERKREQEAYEEAQKQRLRERQLPKRRSTVGPGSRRPRVHYDDGTYRWE